MNWLGQWKAISIRIQALIKAGHFHAQMLAIRSSDTYGGGNQLMDQSEKIYNELNLFSENSSKVLPARAKLALDRFLEQHHTLFADSSGTQDSRFERLKARLTMM